VPSPFKESSPVPYSVTLKKATMLDYPMIQNMARFYVYDLSRECGVEEGWEIPKDGLYECFDLKSYFVNDDRAPYLILADDEIAGFAMINKVGARPYVDWNIGEFFILAKFQKNGVGREAATQIFNAHPGVWNVMTMPLNARAEMFWSQVIEEYTGQKVIPSPEMIMNPHPHPMKVFEFQTTFQPG